MTLVTHAREHVWCNPRADLTYSFILSPVSGWNGYKTRVPEPWGEFNLPTDNDGYVLYQLGSLMFSAFGAYKHLMHGWNRVSKLMVDNGLFIDIYDQYGAMVSRGECYLWKAHNGNLLLAIRRSEPTDQLIHNGLRIRFYYSSWLKGTTNGKIVTDSALVLTDEDKLRVLNGYYEHNRDGKNATFFLNGKQRETVLPADVDKGDMVEFVYDPTIKKVIRYPVSDLRSFTSQLDKQLKYLLHVPKVMGNDIEFKNDFDIGFEFDDGTTEGVYFSIRSPDSVRMVTHHDFSIPTRRLTQLAEHYNKTFKNIVVRFRRSGMSRPLAFTAHRINELYRMSDEQIYEQLVGGNVFIPEWAAVNLEQTMYTELMERYDKPITEAEVIEAYGYNGVVKVTEPNPTKVDVVDTSFKPHLGFSNKATFICYDANGDLLDILPDNDGYDVSLPKGTTLIDGVYGRKSNRCDAMVDDVVSDLLPGIVYRFYYRRVRFGKPIEEWQDAVEDTHYRISNGRVTWLIDVRSNNTLVVNDNLNPYFELSGADYLLRLEIPEVPTNSKGRNLGSNLFTQCDVWMGNKSLIEGIDYKLVHPYIHLYTKKHFESEDPNDFTIKVLLSGFKTANDERRSVGDVGFTRHNKVSHNHIYDVREANNVICNLGGQIVPSESMGFSEDDYLPKLLNMENGIPYQIKQRKCKGYGTGMNVDVEYPKAMALDEKVSQYFTDKFPEPPHKSFSFITERYPVVSGLMNKLIFDLVTNKLVLPEGRLTDPVIEDIMIRYKMLTADDVCLHDFGNDLETIEIHPHILKKNVGVTPRQYEFITRVNSLYLNGRLAVERHIEIVRI